MVSYKSKNSNSLPQTKQHALNILQKTTINTNNPCVVGLLWDDSTHLRMCSNRSMSP